jgi:hypothetical protein
VTKQNPRPRKYASDAEKQAAYRSRAAEVCVRLEPKTMATLDSIADEIGFTRNELMQSMVKFGLTNRDWRNEGLTAHKRLPRYQENPGMATKPPSPAQLAARARFAEMARSGSLNRKRQIAAKKRAVNPISDLGTYGPFFGDPDAPMTESQIERRAESYMDRLDRQFTRGDITEAQYNREVKALNKYVKELYAKNKRKRNPAKKTVSQKISQLVHEGYPQKQAVAVALNEQRAGKVKRNPARKAPARMIVAYQLVVNDVPPRTLALVDTLTNAKKIATDWVNHHAVQIAIKPIEVHASHFKP